MKNRYLLLVLYNTLEIIIQGDKEARGRSVILIPGTVPVIINNTGINVLIR